MFRLDYETYSDVNLKRLGVYAYAASPKFRPLILSFAEDDGPILTVFTAEQIRKLDWLIDPSVEKVAQNAQFERVVTSRIFGLPVGEFLTPECWTDTAAIAASKGYPRHLASLGKRFGEDKDEAGTRLINLFCVPRREFNYERAFLPHERPQDWIDFIKYCEQDVNTLRVVHKGLGDFGTERERQVYLMDQRLNDRGIKIDRAFATAAADAVTVANGEDTKKFLEITGGIKPLSPKLKGWLKENDCEVPNLQAETVEEVLQRRDLKPIVRQALELRAGPTLAAVKKFEVALASAATDDRVRGQFLYHGAHTGRWSGKGIQLHNLPRFQFEKVVDGKKVWDGDAERAAILDVLLGKPVTTETLKRLVRAMLVGPFCVFDYSSIEARVIAWLAEEEWVLQAAREGRDLYVETAAMMTSRAPRIHKTTGHLDPFSRSEGKVAVLGLGFNGGPDALRGMGAEGTDEELQPLVDAYRQSNPRIVQWWKVLQQAFMYGGAAGPYIRVEVRGTSRWIILPSGRRLGYHGVKIEQRTTPWGGVRATPSFIDPQKGYRKTTYGGRLAENVTQGVARDCLAEALVALDKVGLRPVGHIHDELLAETTEVDMVQEIMNRVPAWAPGLPINSEGGVVARYRKM